MSPVETITAQGQIDLATGSMGASVSASEARVWSNLLGSAGKSIDSLPNNKRNVRLGTDLVLAQLTAFTLQTALRPPQSADTSREATKLVNGLRKIQRDCEAH
jgi:hypothetical protein